MTDAQRQPDKQEKDPESKRPDEATRDLEPDKEEGAAVKGGGTVPYERETTVNTGR